MKKIIIAMLAVIPLISMAGNGEKKKTVTATITVTKQGKVELSQNLPELKELERELNKALDNITVKTDDGKKHQVQIKADIKIK